MGRKEHIKRKGGKAGERREDKGTNREQSLTGRERGIVRQRPQDAMRESKRGKEKYSKWTGCRLVEKMRG